jgi:hypothetical protein
MLWKNSHQQLDLFWSSYSSAMQTRSTFVCVLLCLRACALATVTALPPCAGFNGLHGKAARGRFHLCVAFNSLGLWPVPLWELCAAIHDAQVIEGSRIFPPLKRRAPWAVASIAPTSISPKLGGLCLPSPSTIAGARDGGRRSWWKVYATGIVRGGGHRLAMEQSKLIELG